MNRSAPAGGWRQAALCLAACCGAAAPWASQAADGLLARRPVAEHELARQRGTGTGSDKAVAGLSGVVSGNQATQVATGSNQITAGAFAGMSGVPVVIQNSGNNVLIQSSTVINVQLK